MKSVIRLKPAVNRYMRKKVPGFIRDVRFKDFSGVRQGGGVPSAVGWGRRSARSRKVTFENVAILGVPLGAIRGR